MLKLKMRAYALLGFLLLHLKSTELYSQDFSTKDIVESAGEELSSAMIMIKWFCGIGVVMSLLIGGFKFFGENADKPKIVGGTVAAVIFLGLAYTLVDNMTFS